MKKHNRNRVRNTTAAGNATVPWRFFLITAICALILAAGFFFAARQHFISMDFGMKNSTLRKQIDDLEAEKRRLVLAKEISLSPVEVTRTAQKLGFTEHTELAVADRPQPPVKNAEAKPEQDAIPTNIAVKEPIEKRETKAVEHKKLVVPVVQQTAVKASTSGERPRVVPEARKQTSEPVAKALSKLR